MVQRPVKTSGARTFVEERVAGYPIIEAAEVDADLDAIYDAVNTGNVLLPPLTDLSVTTAKLADGAVTTPKLADGAVTDPKIVSVSWAKVTGVPAFNDPRWSGGQALDPLLYPTNGTHGLQWGGIALPRARLVEMAAGDFQWRSNWQRNDTRDDPGAPGFALKVATTGIEARVRSTSDVTTVPLALSAAGDLTLTQSVRVGSAVAAPVAGMIQYTGGRFQGRNATAWVNLDEVFPSIADDSITQPKLADNAVGTAELIDGSVTNAKIASVAYTKVTGTPTELPPTNGSVTASKMAANAVGTAAIQNSAVTLAKIDLNSVPLPPVPNAGNVGQMLGVIAGPTIAWVNPPAGGGGGGAPSGPAGGDLAGTYPNPVIGALKVTTGLINNAAVTRTKTAADLWLPPVPTGADVNKVLTVTAGPVLSWITPTGGGSSYWTDNGTSLLPEPTSRGIKLANFSQIKLGNGSAYIYGADSDLLTINGDSGQGVALKIGGGTELSVDPQGAYIERSVRVGASARSTPMAGEIQYAAGRFQGRNATAWVNLDEAGGGGAPTGPAGGALSGTYPNPGLGSEVVISANVAWKSLGGDRFQDQALDTPQYKDGSVTAIKLAAGVIPTAQWTTDATAGQNVLHPLPVAYGMRWGSITTVRSRLIESSSKAFDWRANWNGAGTPDDAASASQLIQLQANGILTSLRDAAGVVVDGLQIVSDGTLVSRRRTAAGLFRLVGTNTNPAINSQLAVMEMKGNAGNTGLGSGNIAASLIAYADEAWTGSVAGARLETRVAQKGALSSMKLMETITQDSITLGGPLNVAGDVTAGAGTVKLRTFGDTQAYLHVNNLMGATQDDAAKPSWGVGLDTILDRVTINRRAPGGAIVGTAQIALNNLGGLEVPTNGTSIALNFGPRAAKGRLVSAATQDTVYFSNNCALNPAATTWTLDNTATSGWILGLLSTANPATDGLALYRAAPTTGATTQLMNLDGNGYLNTAGAFNFNGTNDATGGHGRLSAYATTGVMLSVNDRWGPPYAANASWNLEMDSAAAGVVTLVHRAPGAAAASSDHTFTFNNAGNFVISGTIGQKQSGTTWSNPSDRRLKDDITDYATGLDAICQLQPRTFLYNGKGGSTAGMRGYGFVADEVASIMPEMVGTTSAKLEPTDEEETNIQTLDQSNLILALVNAVKDLAERVEALEAV